VAAIVPPGLGPAPRKPLTPLGPKIEVGARMHTPVTPSDVPLLRLYSCLLLPLWCNALWAVRLGAIAALVRCSPPAACPSCCPHVTLLSCQLPPPAQDNSTGRKSQARTYPDLLQGPCEWTQRLQCPRASSA